MNKRTHLSFRIKDALKEVSKVQIKMNEWKVQEQLKGKFQDLEDEFIKVSMVN